VPATNLLSISTIITLEKNVMNVAKNIMKNIVNIILAQRSSDVDENAVERTLKTQKLEKKEENMTKNIIVNQ
jgi:hypothetical protein